MIEGEKGKPFEIHETGWGEFEIAIKLYYVPESSEKPQTLYHHLRLHPYGRTEEEKEAMRLNGQVISWAYEEQIFNEPYEPFYEILTSGALPPPPPPPQSSSSSSSSASGARGGTAAAAGGKSKDKDRDRDRDRDKQYKEAPRSEGGVLERSAMVPLTSRPEQPFSRETEQLEIEKLKKALVKVEGMVREMRAKMAEKEEKLKALKADALKG